jgi:hypothetical protein
MLTELVSWIAPHLSAFGCHLPEKGKVFVFLAKSMAFLEAGFFSFCG